ncbi:LANO_0G14994g1_1 [Lachancea nothofagi CBS 11611]|uniref:LANO_0G14994g1_1 n=1 Tax=Lachancea nothofagi CBS 11611 TaxID=1266666 RepID=A0A1G4KKL3_9SACH|nr:LANO_0G14994g1_1 [Lachancea nothofagi CBS 11611]
MTPVSPSSTKNFSIWLESGRTLQFFFFSCSARFSIVQIHLLFTKKNEFCYTHNKAFISYTTFYYQEVSPTQMLKRVCRPGVLQSSILSRCATRSTAYTGRLIQPSFQTLRLLHGSRQLQQEAKYSPKSGFFAERIGKLIRWSILTTGVVVSSLGASLILFFLYDATTYKEGEVPDFINVPKKALAPELGGPENLPVLWDNLDAYDSEAKEKLSYRPKLVVLGSGWASVGVLKSLAPGEFDVTVVSPQNYFLFTPLLPSAATGTLEVKSLMASIRKLVNDVSGHYLEAKAEKVEFAHNLVKVSQVNPQSGEKRFFYLPYDKLVVAVGSTANTHGVEGLENCSRLKTAEDAISLRRKIKDNLEVACLPTTTDEERKKLLSFVVCGGGPTGVEFAAEVFDLMNEDLPKTYPKILRQQVSVHIIQSRSNILNTYDETISEYAMQRFKKDDIDVLTNSRVHKILPDRVIFTQKNSETGENELKELPFGLCLWSTGVAQNPLAKQVVQDLAAFQRNRRAIETDSHLRVLGAPLGQVYAIGDCATVRTDLAEHAVEFVRQFIVNKHLQPTRSNEIITDDDIKHLSISYDEIQDLARELVKRHPQTREHLYNVEDILPKYDKTNSGTLDFNQITQLLREVESKATSMPATAQRAHQQGKYIGKKLTKVARSSETAKVNESAQLISDESVYKAFKYVHLGSLAYIGNSAVFDIPGYSFVGGLVAMYLWRGIYFAQTVSLRTRVLLFMDWLKRGFFGRDILTV